MAEYEEQNSQFQTLYSSPAALRWPRLTGVSRPRNSKRFTHHLQRRKKVESSNPTMPRNSKRFTHWSYRSARNSKRLTHNAPNCHLPRNSERPTARAMLFAYRRHCLHSGLSSSRIIRKNRRWLAICTSKPHTPHGIRRSVFITYSHKFQLPAFCVSQFQTLTPSPPAPTPP